MVETLTIAGWFTAMYYGVRAGGPVAVVRTLLRSETPRRYKLALALCALPIPGPFDELCAAWLMQRLAQQRQVAGGVVEPYDPYNF